MIIHNPILTGSFTVNGTDVASITSSAASIASLNSYTASLNAKSSSFATTGSNTFVGNQVVSGSLTVTGSITTPGTLTAQTLVVQTITSSVDFVTGSTRFGSIIGNTHQFTGSMSVSGSGTFVGNITAGDVIRVSGSGAYFTISDTQASSRNWAIRAGHDAVGDLAIRQSNSAGGDPVSAGTTRLYINASGNVGIGTTAPDLALSVSGALNLRNSTRAGAFEIDSSGNLWIGTATTAGNIYLETGHSTTGLPSTGTARLTLNQNGATFSSTVTATFDATYNNSDNVGLIVRNATTVLKRLDMGYDGTADIAYIQSIHKGTAYKNLALNAQGGNVGIGESGPSYPLQIGSNFTNAGTLSSGGNLNGTAYFGQGGLVVGTQSTTGHTALFTNSSGKDILFGGWNGSTNAERMRITSGGDIQGNSAGSIYSTTSIISIPNSATTIFTSTGYGGVWLVTYNVAGNPAQVGYAIVGNAFGSTLTVLASAAGSQTALSVSGLNLQLSQSAGGSINTRINVIKLNNTIG